MEQEPLEGTEYRDVSLAEAFVILLLVLPIDVAFTELFDQPSRGFFAALSVGVVLSLIWTLRPLARKRTFWGCISVAISLHVLLVCSLPHTGNIRFGLAFLPLAFGDFYLFARITIRACRKEQMMDWGGPLIPVSQIRLKIGRKLTLLTLPLSVRGTAKAAPGRAKALTQR